MKLRPLTLSIVCLTFATTPALFVGGDAAAQRPGKQPFGRGQQVQRPESLIRLASDAKVKHLGPFGFPPKPEVFQQPEYQQALANYKQEVEALVARAQAATPVNHYELFRLYVDLEQNDDFVREARALREADPNDYAIYYELIQAQTQLKRYDEALASAREWLAIDPPLAKIKDYVVPYERNLNFRPIFYGLVAAGRDEDARALSGEIKAKFENLLAAYDAAPPPGIRRAEFNNLVIFQRSAHDDIDRELKKLHPELADGDEALAKITGPLPFGNPLNVSAEYYRLNRRLNLLARQLSHDGPEYKTLEDSRLSDLARLAAAAEAAKSADHDALLNIYRDLHRTDDVIRVAQTVLAADPKSPVSDDLMAALLASEQYDQALALMTKVFEGDAPAAGAGAHLRAWARHAQTMINRFTAEKRRADAVKVFVAYAEHVARVAKAIQAARLDATEGSGMGAAVEMLELNRDFVFGDKPCPPIVADVWLGGGPLKPEDLKGKVVVLEFFEANVSSPVSRPAQLNEWVKKYGDRGLAVISVARRLGAPADDAPLLDFAKKNQLAYPIVVNDSSATFVKPLNISNMPATVFVDRRGVLRHKIIGFGEELNQQREAMLRILLDEKP